MSKAQPLIDVERLSEITAIGRIDGGDKCDVLAVQYDGDVSGRVRWEQTGERTCFTSPYPMDKALSIICSTLELIFPGENLCVILMKDDEARQWVRGLIESVEHQPPSQSWTRSRLDGVSIRRRS